MDKYQKFILEQAFNLNADLRYSGYASHPKTLAEVRDRGAYHYQFQGFTSEKTGRKDRGVFDFEHDTITVVQDEDIYSTRYKYTFSDYYRETLSEYLTRGRAEWGELGRTESFTVTYLSGVSVTKDGVKWQELANCDPCEDSKHAQYELVLDFSDRITKVKFSFVNNLADDYVMEVIYVEADKDEYNRRKAAEDRLRMIAAANIKSETGADLVNIFYSPCSDVYDHTTVILYKGDRMLEKRDVDKDKFYLAINNLAYGEYSFVLSQYAKDGSLIFETDRIRFVIVPPRRDRPSM